MEYQSDSARFVSVMRSLNLRTGESPLLTLNVSALYGNLLAKHLSFRVADRPDNS